MLARLLPQGDTTQITHELTRMGYHTPEEPSHHGACPLAVKLVGVPDEVGTRLIQWLQQQGTAWWHSTSGATARTVDILCRGASDLYDQLRQASQHEPRLRTIVDAVEHALVSQKATPTLLQLGSQALPLGHRTYIMGILNVTPDSFSDGGLYLRPDQAIKHAEEMLADGADIIDVGGQSSRPGALAVPAEVERQRVLPVVREIIKHYDALVSVDTYRADIAEAVLDAGAVLINDISAMRFDTRMASLLARRQASVVLMHMQGTPHTMQQAPAYRHVIDEVYGFLAERLAQALHCGLTRQQIVLDPGVGFGKTVQHNVELLGGLASFRALGQPLLIGTSRKSFLGALLDREVWDRLEGSIASAVYAILQGANIVRVHEVKPMTQAIRFLNTVRHTSLISAKEHEHAP
jgi:dihydropteroate synthase